MTVRTWLITGAGSGLGLALAGHLLDRGERVALTDVAVEPAVTLSARFPRKALVLDLDVTDAAQRAAAVTRAEQHFGGIDVLVNNAGIDFIGALEEQAETDYRKVFEVNFFGAVALTRLVLPGMRARRRGTIVNVSSMDGFASLPANGYYSASKFALEGFTEALWQEIEPLGLHAIIVQPGSFRTGIEHRTKTSGTPIPDYAGTAGAFRSVVDTLTQEMFPGDPARAAAAIHDAVCSDEPPHWLVLGSDAHRRISTKLKFVQTEFAAGSTVAASTDYPGSAKHAVL
jgi:NAD(P)-dependent dehydrogenase (short-subunit alcohol dehydrogenase family)